MHITSFSIQIIDTFENDRVLMEERTEQGAPKLVYNGPDDKYGIIVASELNFNLSVPGAADGAFFHLYTGNDTRYRVRLCNQDNALLWEGFLLPDMYSEPYKSGHLFVEMTASDGIARLKGKTLAYGYYNKETSVIKLIAECLKLTGLSQNITFAPGIVPAAVDYRWDEIAVDGTVYRDDEKVPPFSFSGKLPKRDNAYEILEKLLKSIGCTLYTWEGVWFVIGINRKHEVSGIVELYDANGVFIDTELMVRSESAVTFVATPQIRIVSPWKKVTMTWGIDEDGNLLPENAITEDPDKFSFASGNPFIDASNHGLPNEDPVRNWEKIGGIYTSVGPANGEYVVDNTIPGTISVPYPIGPYNLAVGKKYESGVLGTPDYNVTGETSGGTFQNRIQLKKPKYLKVSDEYILRYLKVRVNVFGNGGSQEMIDDEILQDLFRCQIVVGNTTVVSNRPGGVGYINFKYEVEYRAGSSEVVEENPLDLNLLNFTPEQVTGKLEKDNMTIPINGFLNIYFFAPVSPDPLHPVFFNYTFTDLELEYTAQDEWYDQLVRDIDFTTVYDLDYFHGDSIQDLSKKQFRFRRFIPFPEGESNAINVLFANETFDTFHRFLFAISYQQAQLILQNTALLTVVWDDVDYVVDDLYGPDIIYSWFVVQGTDGVWYINMFVDAHPIFSSINNFESFFIAGAGSQPGQYGFVKENNEWRESWKRYGRNESIRHGLCLGRIYHDVQPEPLLAVEGELFGLYNPHELFLFHWMESRKFIPLRLTMNFSEGKTNVLMMESKIQNINDYAAG